MGDFNIELSKNFGDNFCGSYSLKTFTKKLTCFKNPDNATCIDLILTNKQKSFQNSIIIETVDLHIVISRTSLTYSFEQKL